MGILQDRLNQGAWVTGRRGIETMRSLHHSPPVILSALPPARLKIDFFPSPFTTTPDDRRPGKTIKPKPPGVAQPQGPDFIPRPGSIYERVIGRNSVRTTSVYTVYVNP